MRTAALFILHDFDSEHPVSWPFSKQQREQYAELVMISNIHFSYSLPLLFGMLYAHY